MELKDSLNVVRATALPLLAEAERVCASYPTALKVSAFILALGLAGVAIFCPHAIQGAMGMGSLPLKIALVVAGVGFIATCVSLVNRNTRQDDALYVDGARVEIDREVWMQKCCRKLLKAELAKVIADPKREKGLDKACMEDLKKGLDKLNLTEKEKVQILKLIEEEQHYPHLLREKLEGILKGRSKLVSEVLKLFSYQRAKCVFAGIIQVDKDIPRAQKAELFAKICDSDCSDVEMLRALDKIFKDDRKMNLKIAQFYDRLRTTLRTEMSSTPLEGQKRLRAERGSVGIKEVHFNDRGEGQIECLTTYQFSKLKQHYQLMTKTIDLKKPSQTSGMTFSNQTHKRPSIAF